MINFSAPRRARWKEFLLIPNPPVQTPTPSNAEFRYERRLAWYQEARPQNAKQTDLQMENGKSGTRAQTPAATLPDPESASPSSRYKTGP